MVEYDDNTKVEFEESKVRYTSPTKTPKMVKWVMDHSGGLIKQESAANIALIVFIVLAVIVSLFLFSDRAAEIPEAALENPEYGLPIVD